MGVVPGGTVVNHYLTDTDAWFLLTDVPNGMKHFNRVALETSMDGDFDTGNVRYKARERYSFGVRSPRDLGITRSVIVSRMDGVGSGIKALLPHLSRSFFPDYRKR